MKPALCFDELFDPRQSYSTAYLGVRAIPVERIVGTVGRCGEIRGDFTLIRRRLGKRESFRSAQAGRIADVFQAVDPISVRRYDGSYYVVDGHRRTASAKKLGVAFLDADVTEYLPGDRDDLIAGAKLRTVFEGESGLSGIVLVNTPGYGELLEDLRRFAPSGQVREAARRWRSEVLIPACRAIADSPLPKRYPAFSEADIFALVVGYHREQLGGIDHSVDFAVYLSSYLFALSPKPRRRPVFASLRRLALGIFIRRRLERTPRGKINDP